MLLTVDVGNSNIVIGVVSKGNLVTGRIKSEVVSSDQYASLFRNLLKEKDIDFKNIKAVIISSVVPPINDILSEMFENVIGIKPVFVGPGIKTGIKINTESPQEVGADLIVGAVATQEKYPSPSLIIDLGTATTFIYLTNKTLQGCIIFPGIKLSLDALVKNCSLLPGIQLEVPKKILGRNTKDAMSSGLMHGYSSLIDGLIDKIKQEVQTDFNVIITGGLAPSISNLLNHPVILDMNLISEGLHLIYKKNFGDNYE